MDYDPLEQPHVATEIMGRGSRARRSKSYFESTEHAHSVSEIDQYIQALRDRYRRCHANHYKVRVTVTNPDGTETTQMVPEVLSDEELRARYRGLRRWEAIHDSRVNHYPSKGGFTIVRATSMQAPPPGERKRDETSAGTDQRVRKESEWR